MKTKLRPHGIELKLAAYPTILKELSYFSYQRDNHAVSEKQKRIGNPSSSTALPQFWDIQKRLEQILNWLQKQYLHYI